MASEYEKVLGEVMAEFPKFKIIYKSDSWKMKLLSYLVFFNDQFMTKFHTQVGTTLYVSPVWDLQSDVSKATLLRHERVHMRQNKKYGKLLFSLMYLLLPLPTFVKTYRARFEAEAYEEGMRARLEYRGKGSFVPEYRDWMIGLFTGSAYFWMWRDKKAVSTWYAKTLNKVLLEAEGQL